MKTNKEKLWTSGFISACIGNFLLFFAFYLLLPVLPMYLIEEFHTSKSMVGVILSSYTVAALLIRPFAGFILDLFNRRPLYILAYFLFILTFIGYPLVSFINIFLLLRIFHGITFGMVTTAGNSLIVDIMPASRRGEGLGYFGVANNLAMAIGPMISLFLHDYYQFDIIFYTAILSGFVGFLFALNIKTKKSNTGQTTRQPIAFDRFFLFKGFKSGFCLLLLGIPYGMLTTYVAIYGTELGIKSGMGLFFTIMAIGLISSRLFAGKMVDNGKLTKVISVGTFVSILGFAVLSLLKYIEYNNVLMTGLFYLVAVVLGVGYGMVFPAYNTLFVDLAPNNRRATASSTYMTSWDLGIGTGLVLGGSIADGTGGLQSAYIAGTLIVALSLLFFERVAAPHFKRNKLR